MNSRINDVGPLTLTREDPLAISNTELWDNISPLSGSVRFSITNGPQNHDPQYEYIKLSASHSNTEAINMTGWSIQSLVSNTRVYLPPATLMLRMQQGNTTQRVNLAPGEYIILHTGHSPIAQYSQSFHTNKCIGYLNQFITFHPRIKSSCTDPASILPATVENVRTYGEECINFLKKARKCTTYTTHMPAKLLPICRDLIARKLTYHSCLSEGFEQDGYTIFNNGGWYLYLGHDSEVWRNNYEAMRLLDSDNKVVDVLRY